MTREAIESSNIAAIGYDPDNQRLVVEFKANRAGVRAVWEYFPVPDIVFDAMRNPENSAGRIFHAEVKGNPLVTSRLIEEIPEPCGVPAGMPT